MLNTKSLELEKELVKIINSAELPPIVIELTLHKILGQVINLTQQTIAQEAQAQKEQVKEEPNAEKTA